MTTTELLSKPLFSLTVGEFLELQKRMEQPAVQDFTKQEKKYVYGIEGLAAIYGCSRKTAQRIKSSGKIDKAITQVGRTIVIDAELAIKNMQLSNRRKA